MISKTKWNILCFVFAIATTLPYVNASNLKHDTSFMQTDNKKREKTVKKGEFLTIYMGREARNITVDWSEDTNCEFDIQISSGHGCFESVLTGKAKGKGRQTYSYVRTSVEELRIVITKGQGTICNMETLSTKADDNQSYNPI